MHSSCTSARKPALPEQVGGAAGVWCGAKCRWFTWENIKCEQQPGKMLKRKIKSLIILKNKNNLYPTVIMGHRQSILGDTVEISICPFKLRHALMVLTVVSVRCWRLFKPGTAILTHVHHHASGNEQQSNQSM